MTGEPLFRLDPSGRVELTWPEGRADAVMMRTELLEQWVDDRNDMVAEIARLKARR